jgi:hypothetical protein
MAKFKLPSIAERAKISERLAAAETYGKPRKVWVEDGHVFVEGHNGDVVSMTPEVAIEMGRLLGNAGADSLVNKIMDPRGPVEPE